MGLHLLVLAGGSGTRLWPLSRGGTPKHLLPLAPGGQTLLRATLERVRGLGDSVHVVTAAAQAEPCRAELAAAGLDPNALIAEPVARGTGPALALATAWLAAEDPSALVASVHADHRVADAAAYRAAVLASAGWAAASGGLSTVGLEPARPDPSLGYIELGAELDAAAWRPQGHGSAAEAAAAARLPAFHAAGFREKPEPALAEQFAASGRHLWNLGLFAWSAGAFLEELASRQPGLAAGIDRSVQARRRGDEAAAGQEYAALATSPVEPLLLEGGARLVAVRAGFAWSDVGSWSDLRRVRLEEGAADAQGNVVEGEALAIGSSGCLVHSRGGRRVVLVGAEDLVVVDTPGAVLVVPADQAQQVRDAVEALRRRGWD